MITTHESRRDGKVIRVFHRNESGSAWTHAPGERYRYHSKSWKRWVEMRCDCPAREGDKAPTGAVEPPETQGGRKGARPHVGDLQPPIRDSRMRTVSRLFSTGPGEASSAASCGRVRGGSGAGCVIPARASLGSTKAAVA